MNRCQADSWSPSRSLAFLAATFALMIGALLPFGVMAAATPGQPIVICSAQGPMTIQVGGDMDGPGRKTHPAKCAACVMPLAAALPAPVAPEPPRPFPPRATIVYVAAAAAPPPPARAPPRPPSTAPPAA